MSIFYSPLAAQIIFILGIINFIVAMLLLSTCRCIPMLKPFKGLMKNKTFQRYYKWHCYLWWVFFPSVIVHVIFAVGRLGMPF